MGKRKRYAAELRQELVRLVGTGRSPESLAREFEPDGPQLNSSSAPAKELGAVCLYAKRLGSPQTLLLRAINLDIRHTSAARTADENISSTVATENGCSAAGALNSLGRTGRSAATMPSGSSSKGVVRRAGGGIDRRHRGIGVELHILRTLRSCWLSFA